MVHATTGAAASRSALLICCSQGTAACLAGPHITTMPYPVRSHAGIPHLSVCQLLFPLFPQRLLLRLQACRAAAGGRAGGGGSAASGACVCPVLRPLEARGEALHGSISGVMVAQRADEGCLACTQQRRAWFLVNLFKSSEPKIAKGTAENAKQDIFGPTDALEDRLQFYTPATHAHIHPFPAAQRLLAHEASAACCCWPHQALTALVVGWSGILPAAHHQIQLQMQEDWVLRPAGCRQR